MRTVLIDGDILVVSGCAAAMVETCWDEEDDVWTYTSDLKAVKNTLLGTISNIKKELEADHAVITLSQGLTFRHQIFPTYKAGRGRKPIGCTEVKRWLISDHAAKCKPGIEADDVLGILQTHGSLITGETVIASADKDLKTIPGELYQGGQWLTITPQEATYNWLFQTLTGDVTDGYPGCKGVGAVAARKVLNKLDIENESEWWKAIVETFAEAGFDEQYALTQARCARILHASDYDFKRKEVKLWRPST